MNLRMAYRACLILVRLVMKRWCARRGEIHRRRVALQAEGINVGDLQQPRIGRAMWRMARHAALSLDGRVLIDPWSGRFNVALGADGVLGRADAKLLRLEGAVRIMAVAACDQPFVHLVVEGLGECRLDIRMAAITELGLRNLKQVFIRLRLVNAMAAVAAYAGFAVGGPRKIGVGGRMAAKTLLVDHPGRRFTKLEYLRGVPARIDVRLARPMAVLAGNATIAVQEGHADMRILGKFLDFVLVTGSACF